MSHPSDIAFSDSIKRAQEEHGSRKIYANLPKGAGWDTETGRLYLRTKDGHYNEESRKVLEVAAEVRAL